MSDLRVEYPGAGAAAGLGTATGPGAGTGPGAATGPQPASRRGRPRPRRFLGRIVRWVVTAVLLAVLPFILLVRGGVFAYQQWGLGAWSSLAVSTAATALLLACYAWAASRRRGAG